MYSNDQTVKGPFKPQITVFGVGGAGGNAVNNMIASKLEGVNFVVGNTDAQALENSLCSNIIQLGKDSTGGLGAGARPEIGRTAAEESMAEIMSKLEGQNMVFITAGMGGGTGTGAAPLIAQACKEKGILTVGVVTKPFQFEGAQRMRLAEAGIEEMAQHVDTLIVIPNQNLFRLANEKTTFSEAFRMADNVLLSGVKGVADLMVVPGMINLDFADIRSATSEMGKAMMGTGEATGDRRAIEAAEQAINNPLLDDVSMKGARSVIINITGGHDLTLFEIEEACNRINDEVDPDATIIFGSTYDDSLEGTIRITVVATGIEAEINRRAVTKPLRAPAVQIQPKHVEETAPMNDSFMTRYPEPSRIGQSTSASSGQQSSAPSYQHVTDITPPQQPQQQAAVASASNHTTDFSSHQQNQPSTPVAETHQQVGEIDVQYVSEGSAIRKVDVAHEQSQTTHSYGGMIPPYAPPRDEQPTMESSLTLTPPARPAMGYHTQQQAAPKKTPSLFERITGRGRQDDGDIDSVPTQQTTNTSQSSSTGGNGALSSGLMAERTVAKGYEMPTTSGQQGQLNIDTPYVAPKQNIGSSTEDLDIPAFLRRQIS